MRNEDLPLFLTLKHDCITFANEIGSSITKRTRSRLTLANNKISLHSSVQYDLIVRPSIRNKSPPAEWNYIKCVKCECLRLPCELFNLPKIHCRSGMANMNGLHLVNTNLDSRSCSVSNGRPSPVGSIRPLPMVISRCVACNVLTTADRFLYSFVSAGQCDVSTNNNFNISRKCCNGRWMNDVKSGRLRGTCGIVMNATNCEVVRRDLFTKTQSARFRPLQYFL